MIKSLAILIVAMSVSVSWAKVIQIEAEDAAVDAANIVQVKKASGGKAISFNKKTKQSTAKFKFEVDADGAYQIWGVASGPNANADSFFVQMDKGGRETWDLRGRDLMLIPMTKRQMNEDGKKYHPKKIEFELTKGKHVLTISRREAGAVLDKIIIASKGVDVKKELEKK